MGNKTTEDASEVYPARSRFNLRSPTQFTLRTSHTVPPPPSFSKTRGRFTPHGFSQQRLVPTPSRGRGRPSWDPPLRPPARSCSQPRPVTAPEIRGPSCGDRTGPISPLSSHPEPAAGRPLATIQHRLSPAAPRPSRQGIRLGGLVENPAVSPTSPPANPNSPRGFGDPAPLLPAPPSPAGSSFRSGQSSDVPAWPQGHGPDRWGWGWGHLTQQEDGLGHNPGEPGRVPTGLLDPRIPALLGDFT